MGDRRVYMHVFACVCFSCTCVCLSGYFLCVFVHLCICMCNDNQLIGPLGRVFANGPEDLGSIPGRIIPKTLKWYLISPWLTLNNIRYVSSVKWSNPGKGVAISPTPRCSSYWKGSLLVALDYSRQLYFYYV